jgi:hypothetical protein
LLNKFGKHLAATLEKHNPSHNASGQQHQLHQLTADSANSSGHGHAESYGLDDADAVCMCPTSNAEYFPGTSCCACLA